MAAFFMIVAILTIVLPMTNTVPSVGLALMAAGLDSSWDGLFVLGRDGVAGGLGPVPGSWWWRGWCWGPAGRRASPDCCRAD
ncbi:hypothetical protein MBEBAB_1865 [Brevundimonas abyssalis TAR-001]|uniref:Uncharacterized protein n=1 Tax=Brevundimonas abyssalis TAR-001 TaxID=1391729 RepID=A0A8E0NC32_9CAUL|nr:hypothetical protein MBEBAB_1865 [Brevundimonas abyssalis TAR-001]